MIGYYVHHHGSGHLHRAVAVASQLGLPVTGLSSLERPADWHGDWVKLAWDTGDRTAADVTAGGRLHWAPIRHDGLRSRMAQVSAWIARSRPELMVCDVSVEVTVLARLHGIPVVGVVLPGDRGDAAHTLGFDVCAELVAMWPTEADGMVQRLRPADASRLRCLGGLSRFPVRPTQPRRAGRKRVTVLLGAGGDAPDARGWESARAQTPDWDWTVLGREMGSWTEHPYEAVCDADVVVTHAGQNAIAEVAAARRPAVVIPSARPHDEQIATAAVLREPQWPALVEMTFPLMGWSRRLDEVAAFDPAGWERWTDGRAAGRFCDVVRDAVTTRPAQTA